MPLLNYTTSIKTEKTVSEIQAKLVKAGARAILYDYDDTGAIVALSFKLNINGTEAAFRLPTEWRPVLQLLNNDPKVPIRLKSNEQALRVAWRIVKDWVEAQLAIIETKMVKTEQVFLPYMVTGSGKTLYETIKDNPRLLEAGDDRN